MQKINKHQTIVDIANWANSKIEENGKREKEYNADRESMSDTDKLVMIVQMTTTTKLIEELVDLLSKNYIN
jgi:hypothetical protein